LHLDGVDSYILYYEAKLKLLFKKNRTNSTFYHFVDSYLVIKPAEAGGEGKNPSLYESGVGLAI